MIPIVLVHHRISNDAKLHNSHHQRSSRIPKKPPDISELIEKEKEFLRNEMEFFGFTENDLKNLTLDTNGVPIRGLIITEFRSGSTFLIEALKSLSGMYYHQDPLKVLEVGYIRGPPYDIESLNMMKNLFNCKFSGPDMNVYRKFAEKHERFFLANDVLWRHCLKYPKFCSDEEFLDNLCKLYPFQIMRASRSSLEIAAQMLEDNE